MNHHTFIKHYEGVVPNIVCDWLVDSFESSNQLVTRRNGPQNFDEMNLNQFREDAANTMVRFMETALRRYVTDVQETVFFPDLAIEEFRVKRYTGGTDQQFAEHVDVGSLASAKRYLSFLFYLNDNFTGGQTLFYPTTTITPLKGSVLVFPPMWMYPHAGLPVETGNKYIMSSYLNYAE